MEGTGLYFAARKQTPARSGQLSAAHQFVVDPRENYGAADRGEAIARTHDDYQPYMWTGLCASKKIPGDSGATSIPANPSPAATMSSGRIFASPATVQWMTGRFHQRLATTTRTGGEAATGDELRALDRRI